MTPETSDYDEAEIETENPTESGIYVWDHTTETVAADGFECREHAEIWAAEHGVEYEPVDARPLGTTERDSSMRRSGAMVPEARHDVVDYVADYAHDAADAGLDAGTVASALREAADELEDRAMQGVDAEDVLEDLSEVDQ